MADLAISTPDTSVSHWERQAVLLRSGDTSPASDVLSALCESRDAARGADDRMIEKVRASLLKRGDKAHGVGIK